MKQPKLPDGEIDLGDGHWLRYSAWNPDIDLNPKYAHLKDMIRDQPVIGAIVRHVCKTETGMHEGAVHFKTEVTDAIPSFGPSWTVEAWEPLTISPSLVSSCPCGNHGFIRQGKWVRA